MTLTGVTGPGCHGITGAVCSTARWEYDAVGNVSREIIPRGTGGTQEEVSRGFSYDKVQRPLTRTNELGQVWSTA